MVVKKRTIQILLILGIFVAISIALGSVSSETLINFVGSDNAFVLMFALGIVGGLTTFSGIPYQFVLMSLAAGGINPIGLGLSTAIGVMIGDSTMFFISKKLKTALSSKTQKIFKKVYKYLEPHPSLINLGLFLYGLLSPFSNDFVVASMSIMGYSYRKIIVPLAIGNIFFNIGLAYLGLYAYDSIIGFF